MRRVPAWTADVLAGGARQPLGSDAALAVAGQVVAETPPVAVPEADGDAAVVLKVRFGRLLEINAFFLPGMTDEVDFDFAVAVVERFGDRKSTRLNSSHVAI